MQGAQGLDDAVQGFMVPPFQGSGVSFTNQTQGFTLGCHIAGLQPYGP